MKIFIFLFLLIAATSCNYHKQTKSDRDGDLVYSVSGDDKEMNDAIKKANQTLNKFNEALESRNSNFKYFALKTRLTAAREDEPVWVHSITKGGISYLGVVDNVPESASAVHIGDTIKIEINNISDWMYLDDKKLRGGFTIRVLRERMTEKERNQYDAENGFVVEN